MHRCSAQWTVRSLLGDNWLTEGFIAVAYGCAAGWGIQLSADSGDYIPEKLWWSLFTGGLSYLCALLIGLGFRQSRIPSWVWLGGLGSLIFALARAVIVYTVVNCNSPVRTGVHESVYQMTTAVIVLTNMFALPLITVLICVRLVRAGVERIVNRQWCRDR